ncbi:hypothetical protein ACTRXD_16950 [Nitrospira sp. T9]|uniref:hypothetical protein n=1 Tax=unclassified Nitrospira TaxID=2652172 RepID=UPI003F9A615B
MFITAAQRAQTESRLIREEVAQWSLDERRQFLYAAICRQIEQSEALGFTSEDMTAMTGLIYYDRKHRLSDVPFPTSKDELAAIFKELDQEDPDTQLLMNWLGKNLPRFSRLGLHNPSTAATLKDLMLATGLGLQDRNPGILRSVAKLALEEYLSRNYDRDKLKDLLQAILDQLNDE